MSTDSMVNNMVVLCDTLKGIIDDLNAKGYRILSVNYDENEVFEVHMAYVEKFAQVLGETLTKDENHDSSFVQMSFERQGVKFFGLLSPGQAKKYMKEDER